MLFIMPVCGIPLFVVYSRLFSGIGGWLEGGVNKPVTSESTFSDLLSYFIGRVAFYTGGPIFSVAAALGTIVAGIVLYDYLNREYLPRKKKKWENKKMFDSTKLDYKQYEVIIKSLEKLELLNLNDHTCPNKILSHTRVKSIKTQLNNAIQRLIIYLSTERKESFSLGEYPEVFNKIAKEFHVMIPSLNQFITEYESIKKLDLDEEHTEKVVIFLKDITDCLINFKERILPEFQQAKHYKNAMLHVELDISTNNVKFEKSYLTKQEQFPEFIDQYEEGDPRIRELTMKMKTTTSVDITKSPNNLKER
ncbi:hypothetical protein H9S87_18775 (plasmid) [Bacillus pumilus]|uniref:hypothetical protein n=1 Tax=Bacillus pumilus TaxID=1408 RepID=UPI001657D139|nr:hypothetical protein [Bacillus pumilus]QNP18329.1 hypothetical protein H9S87_18775 [Bacillus pumilus]